MGHSTSNMGSRSQGGAKSKHLLWGKKIQEQPYGQEKTECHNPVLIFRVASESSLSVSLMCLETSLPLPRNGPFYFLLSSLTSQLLAFWVCSWHLHLPWATLLLQVCSSLPHVFAADFLFAPLVSTLYTCACEKSKKNIMLGIYFYYLFPVSFLCDVFTCHFTEYGKHAHLIVKTTWEMCQTSWFLPTDAFIGDGSRTCFVKHNPRFCSKEKEIHIQLLCTPLEKSQQSHKTSWGKKIWGRLFDSEPCSKKKNQ